MSDFDSVAPFLSHPLVLIGFVLVLVFGVHRTLITAGIIPKLSQRSGNKIVQLLLRYGFWLALLIVLLGFALQFYKTSRKTVDVEAIVHVLMEAQSKQLAQLGSEFEARHEKEISAWKTLATQAVSALAEMRERPNAPEGVYEALRKLHQGDTGLAVQVFREIAEETTAPKNVRAQAYRNQGALIFFEDPARAAHAFRRAETLESGSVTEETSTPQWKPSNQEQAFTPKDRDTLRDSREHALKDTRDPTAQAQRKPTATPTAQAQSTNEGLANTEAITASGEYAPAQGQTWPRMVEIPAGQFIMGSETVIENEQPLHLVTFSQPFYLSATEVSFAQYDAFCGDTGRELPPDEGWGRGNRPVIHVSWPIFVSPRPDFPENRLISQFENYILQDNQ